MAEKANMNPNPVQQADIDIKLAEVLEDLANNDTTTEQRLQVSDDDALSGQLHEMALALREGRLTVE